MIKRVKILVMLLGLVSCRKQDLPLYQGPQSLCFVKTWDGNTAYSFVQNGTLATTEEQLHIPIFMVGGMKTTDTLINYQVEIETDNLTLIGEEGTGKIVRTGYLDRKRMTDTLLLNIVRIPALADTDLLVHVKLMVAAPYNAVVEGADKLGFLRELDIIIDDMFPTPVNWQIPEQYLGTFSSKKMRIVSQKLTENYNLSGTWNEVRNEFNALINNGQGQEVGAMLYDFLEEQKRLGTRVLERNGQEMRAGPLMYQ